MRNVSSFPYFSLSSASLWKSEFPKTFLFAFDIFYISKYSFALYSTSFIVAPDRIISPKISRRDSHGLVEFFFSCEWHYFFRRARVFAVMLHYHFFRVYREFPYLSTWTRNPLNNHSIIYCHLIKTSPPADVNCTVLHALYCMI